MAGKIPRAFINELIAKTDIIDFISARIKLKKIGKNHQGFCPFHNEKRPSFTVNEKKQFFHCFGCGIHGNIVDFLMSYSKLEFVEAIKELAIINNLEISYEGGEKISSEAYHHKHLLYQLMKELKSLYQQALKRAEGFFAHQYLIHRGLNDEIITQFAIGYANQNCNNITTKYCYKKNHQLLIETGMLVTNRHGEYYDLLRGRIVFPIRDKRGRVIGFGGRMLENSLPKYINSPNTDIFHKGSELYGLYEAQQNKETFQYVLVVEGYMDVIALTQYGIKNSVALQGTSITPEHIQKLFRITNDIIYCYDGDNAGYLAAWRTVEISLPYLTDERQIRFIFLPNNEDPDTLVRKEGKTSFEMRIKKAQSFSTFLFKRLMSRVDLNTINGKAKLSALALPLINKIPGVMLRFYLRQELGKKLGIVDESQLERLILKKVVTKTVFQNKTQLELKPIQILISLLIHNPHLASLVPTLTDSQQKKLPGLGLFIKLVNICLSHPNITTGQLLEYYRGTKYFSLLEKLLMRNDIVDEDIAEKMFIDSLNHIFKLMLELRQEELIAKDRINGLSSKERQEFWMLNQKLAKNN